MDGNREQKPVRRGFRSTLDFIGIRLSLLCLVHCLALPLLIVLAPVILRSLPGDVVTHRALAVAILPVGLLAFRFGYRVHRRRWILAVFIAGLLLISTAAFFGEEFLTGYTEVAVTVCGGILLVTAHLLNHCFCRSDAACDCCPACSCEEDVPGRIDYCLEGKLLIEAACRRREN